MHVSGTGDTTILAGMVMGNIAASEGGGLWNGSGTMTIDGTTITRNIASGNDADNGGGGVFNNGGTLIVTAASITSNVADGTSGSGGGVLNFAGDAIISDTLISGNIANRAGVGVESTADSNTTLNNTNLDGNNAGVVIDPAMRVNPLLEYFFAGSGTNAAANGSASDPSGNPTLVFTDNNEEPANLRGPAGSGVSGQPGDLAFDNTASTGFSTASAASHAADFDAIDALDAFTLSGWFKLPSSATESIGRQDALIENGTISVLDAPGGFRLRGGSAADSGALQLTVNRTQTIESSEAYTEIGEYVYFAVSYDGTQTSDNVKFYKGTTNGAVSLVDTLTLNAGQVKDEMIPLSIGVTRTSGLTLNPFNGLLDDIRIDGSVVSLGELESRRFIATGLSDSIAANPGNGGGLHISGNGIVRINNGTVNGNLAAKEGGGLWNSGSGNLIVDGTMIDGNSAEKGGGVYSDGGNTVLTNAVVSENVAAQNGGGIYLASSSLSPVLTANDSIVRGNMSGATDAGSGGGGIYAAGSAFLTNTDLIDNTATEGTADGGGAFVTGFGTNLSLDGGIVSGNQAARAGGAIENSDGFVTSFDIDFDGNTAGVNGGALHQSGFANAVLSGGTIRNNIAANEGGGLWTSTGAFLAVIESTFDANDAMFGGAIFGDQQADVSVDDSVFTNNTADVNGGGIAIEGGTLFLSGNSLSGNSAGGNAPGLGGGAIYTAAENQISSNDLINNTALMPLGNGGGILIAAGATGTYFGGIVQGNVAGRAGGGLEVAGQITLDRDVLSNVDLAIDGNIAGINGGGLHISGSGDVLIRRSSVTNNLAAGEGGGLWNSAAGSLVINTSTVSSNVASGDGSDQGGGGIYSDGGDLTIDGSVVSDNLADGEAGSGGGILSNGAMLVVTDSAITSNIAVRAGGGIETVGTSTTTLTDVNLDSNSAGLDRSLAGANVPAPLLAYLFNETGNAALATGTSANGSGDPLLNFNANGSTTPADLHGADGGGVSGAPGDRAFDNTAASGFFNVSGGQHAADFDAIDTLDAFTLSGWHQLPSGGESIGRQDALIENGSLSGSNQGGFRLRAGAAANASTLRLTVDGTTVESSADYSETGEYVFFAVTYDGTSSTDNVNFYKGTTLSDVTLVATRSLAANTVNDVAAPLVIGKTPQSFFFNPFNGQLDNIRIDGSALPSDALEFLRADAIGAATGVRANPGNGGGLYVSGGGDVNISGGSVSGNFAASEGGGLWNGTGTMTIDSTTISDNVAAGDDATNGGGGVFNNGGTLDITNSNISDNAANGISGSGGGVFSVGGDVTIMSSEIDSNGANRAGCGIEIFAGTVLLIDSDLTDNDVNAVVTGGAANPGNGGGLHVSGVADVTIDGGRVSGNVAASEGGGLWNQSGSTLAIQNGTLIQVNTALGDAADNGGGGIFNNGGIVDISDATILSNFADGASGSGGGILNFNGGVITISDTVLSQNVASCAGGVSRKPRYSVRQTRPATVSHSTVSRLTATTPA